MTARRIAEIMLDPHPASVGRARRWLSSQLEEWGLEDLDYDASVVLSELVTNAVLHARTQIDLKLSHGQVLRLEVCDSSDTLPTPRGPHPSSTTGRGLHLVAALSSAWGFEQSTSGKMVWAEFGTAEARRDHESASGAGATISSLSDWSRHKDPEGTKLLRQGRAS